MIEEEKINLIIENYNDLEKGLANSIGSGDYAELSKKFSDLSPIAEIAKEIKKNIEELNDLNEIISDNTIDKDVKSLAIDELKTLNTKIIEHDKKLSVLLLPKDLDDARNVILEIRAGTGGDEAAIFASDLLRMYQRYSDIYSWKFEIMNLSDNNLGGVKEASVTISGRNVFSRLKYESGVHRVQRVPITESSGRIHTSAATVAVDV